MFEIEIKIALLFTLIFWVVFFCLCFYWSRMKYQEKRINFISASLVSLYYSFIFFLASFGILVLLSWLKKYLPDFLKIFKTWT